MTLDSHGGPYWLSIPNVRLGSVRNIITNDRLEYINYRGEPLIESRSADRSSLWWAKSREMPESAAASTQMRLFSQFSSVLPAPKDGSVAGTDSHVILTPIRPAVARPHQVRDRASLSIGPRRRQQ